MAAVKEVRKRPVQLKIKNSTNFDYAKKRVGARPYKNYEEENLKKAVADVRRGMSIRKASKKYGIPPATVQRKVKNKHMKKVGRPTTFSADTENTLVKIVALCAEWGFPITTYDLAMIIKQYLDTKGITEIRFKNNLPGRFWIAGFLKRNKNDITQKFCENIKRTRAMVTHEQINEFFDYLSDSLENIPAEAITNYDETNMTDDPGKQKVLVRRGFKNPKNVLDTYKSSTSVMFAATAAGTLLPPYIVYKAEHLYPTWIENGPEKAAYNRTRSGWFDTMTFKDWFLKIVVPYFQSLGDGPKALLGDNCASHLSEEVIRKCEQMNVKFIYLPIANSTNICQPLDLSVFRALKQQWRKTLMTWKSKHRGVIPKDQFPCLLKQALLSVTSMSENIKSGFRTSGIYPLNRNKALEKLPSVSEQNEEREQGWVNAFETFLKEHRFTESKAVKPRRKRIQVPPGKGVMFEDLNNSTTQKDITVVNIDEMDLGVNIDDDTTNEDPLGISGSPKAGTSGQYCRANPIKKRKVTKYDSDNDSDDEYSVHDTTDDDYDINDDLFDETETLSNIFGFETPQLPQVGQPQSPGLNVPQSPQVGRPQSPQVGRPQSPRVNRSQSPRVNLSQSPRVNRPQSPQVSRPHSPQVTRPQLLQSNRAQSPQLKPSQSIQVNRQQTRQINQHQSPQVKWLKSPEIRKALSSKNVIKENISEYVDGPKVGEFVKVYLLYNENTKKETKKEFIAQVTEISENGYTGKFLKQVSVSKGIYVFPDVDDIMVIKPKQVICSAKIKSNKRGRMMFD